MLKRRDKHKDRCVSDDDCIQKWRIIKKLEKQQWKCATNECKLKIVLRKINLPNSENVNLNKENKILNKVDSTLSPRLNLFRIDSVIPSGRNTLFDSMKINEDDKELLLRRFNSKYNNSKRNNAFRGFDNMTMHNVNGSSTRAFNTRNKNKLRNALIDLNVQTTFCGNEDFKENNCQHLHDFVSSSADVELKNVHIRKANAVNSSNNILKSQEVFSNISRKELAVKLTQLSKNLSSFHKTFVENEYTEGTSMIEEEFKNREREIYENFKFEKMVGFDFHSKGNEIKKEATEVIYTETLKNIELPPVTKRKKRRPRTNVNHVEVLYKKSEPQKDASHVEVTGKRGDVGHVEILCKKDKSLKDASRVKVLRKRGRPRKNTVQMEELSMINRKMRVSFKNASPVKTSAVINPKKRRHTKNIDIDVSSVLAIESEKRSKTKTRFKFGKPNGIKLNTRISDIKNTSQKIDNTKIIDARKVNQSFRKRLKEVNSTSEIQTRFKAAKNAKSGLFCSLPINKKKKVKIEKITTVKNIKSEETGSINSSVVFQSSKNFRKSKKKLNVSFNTPHNSNEIGMKSNFTTKITTEQCKILQSSTPYAGKKKRTIIIPDVPPKKNTMQLRRRNILTKECEEFLGFPNNAISANRFRFISSVSNNTTISSKSRRRMSKKEAEKKTESFNLCKKTLEGNSKHVRSSKRLQKMNFSTILQNNPLTNKKASLIKVKLFSAPYVVLNKLKLADISSYKITPLKEDRIPGFTKTEEDYGIDDVNTDDSTDDEDFPKKRIPLWAQEVKDGCSERYRFQSFLRRDLLCKWMKPPKYRHSLHTVFFK